MEIEILEMEERKCKFILKNSTPSMANALRRTMLSDIPKMAIDSVDFHMGPIDVGGKEHESITPLFNEVIAHRLGMVPVPTDPMFTYMDQCTCGGEGCPNCTIMYSLMKNGPCTVLSGDLIPLGSADLEVKDKEIPIVELTADQSVMIYAHAVLGTAKKHVKWQVANGVGYKYMPVINIESGRYDADEIAEKCPKKVFSFNGTLSADRPIDCIGCNKCTDLSDGKITVGYDDTCFLFKFETDGSLTAEQVLAKAKQILSDRAFAFAEKLVAL